MNFLKSLLFIVLLFTFGSHALAQCGGSFFKTGARMLLPPFLIRNTADFNGDGKLDLLGGNPDSSGAATSLFVIFGNGDGTFAAPQNSLPVSFEYPAFHIADIDSDGKADIFVKRYDNTYVIYRSNGDGTFTALAPTLLMANEVVDSVADVNSDGRLDLFTRTEGIGGTQQYRLGNPDGSFGSRVVLTVGGFFQYPGDFNNDGKVDFPLVATTSGPETYQLRINYGNGSGGFTQTGNLISAGGLTTVFALRDFNNDGKLDVALRTILDPPWKFIILFNHGNNNFTRAEFRLMENENDSIFIGDFDGDNALDFLIAPPLDDFFSIWKNNGAGVFEQRVYNYALPNSSRFIAGKFDADGKTDFIRVNARVPSLSTTFVETQLTFMQNVCNSPGQTKIVDFDHNSKSDLAVWRESDGRWRYLNRGTTETPGTIPVFNWGTVGDIPAPGDFDGDGTTDYAVYRPSNGVWYIRNSSDGSYLFRQWGLGGDKPVASDYNGDGRSDIAVYRPSNGNWYVLFSGSAQYYIAHFGIAEDKPVQEDYDGDGKTDLAVYRPSTGVWYYLKSSGSNGSFGAILFGNSSDQPQPGDYDGDGKSDFCHFRPSTGDWHVLRSYNFQSAQIHYGLAGDVPQGGDWDGDGISDFAVYRPSTSVWYVMRWTNYHLGEAGEIPVGSIVR